MQAIDGQEEELGFTLKNRRSRRVKPEMITDLDFEDDIALLSDQIKQAQELMNQLEKECKKIGLAINDQKTTRFMAYNIDEEQELTLLDGTKLKEVNDFKYLGSWVVSTVEDIRIRRPCVGYRKQDEEDMGIKYLKEPQGTSLRGNCGISAPVWTGSLDIDQISGKAVEWLLH